MSENKTYKAEIKKLNNSEVEIVGVVAEEVLSKHKKVILDEARKDIEAPGFRKGSVPDNILLTKVNEHKVMQDAAEKALNEIYPSIVKENDLDVLGMPEVSITKLASGNPLEFKMKVGVISEIKLPDYKKITSDTLKNNEVKEAEVTEDDISAVVSQILSMRAQQEKPEGEQEEQAEKKPAELTDEFVKTLGDFKDVADFKEKLKENMKKEKMEQARKDRRDEILKNITDKTKLDLPETLVRREAEEVHRKFIKELAESNTTLEDYLKKVNKTEDEVKQQHHEYVEQTLKSRLILDKIATDENIKANEEEIKKNAEFLLMKHPEADKDYINNYVRTILTNEAVIDFLEKEASDL